MKFISMASALALAAVLLFSCQKEIQPSPQALTLAEGACSEKTVTIWAGKTTNAGSMTVSNDAANVYGH